MPYQLTDGCIESVEHYSTLSCSSVHHCGPLFIEGARMLCGECGRVVDVIPPVAHTAHQRYRNRFIPVVVNSTA